MFRRRSPQRAALDSDALLANCQRVLAELSEDFDWRLADPPAFAAQIAGRCAEHLAAIPPEEWIDSTLRRLIESECCAEYFAALYDGIAHGGLEREHALTELFRPEESASGSGVAVVYRGYLYRAALYYLQRLTNRQGWNPAEEERQELARATAEEVIIALLRAIDLRQGRRAFWSYLGRAVERRAIDQLRAFGRRQRVESLDELREQHDAVEGAAFRSPHTDPDADVTNAESLLQMMAEAGLSREERYALVAGAYGLNDSEAARELGRRMARAIGPPDIRRWRFRAREKLRRVRDPVESMK